VSASALSEDERQAWGAAMPINMGGEYLPDLEDGEVEIARVVVESVMLDVSSVRAREDGDIIRYRVVDEQNSTFEFSPTESSEPFSLGEVVELIDSATSESLGEGGLVLGFAEFWVESGVDPDELGDMAYVWSAFYPGLTGLYRDALVEAGSARA